MLSAHVNSNTRLHSIALHRFLKLCSGPPKFKNIRGPLGPGPVGPLVNAAMLEGGPSLQAKILLQNTRFCKKLANMDPITRQPNKLGPTPRISRAFLQ